MAPTTVPTMYVYVPNKKRTRTVRVIRHVTHTEGNRIQKGGKIEGREKKRKREREERLRRGWKERREWEEKEEEGEGAEVVAMQEQEAEWPREAGGGSRTRYLLLSLSLVRFFFFFFSFFFLAYALFFSLPTLPLFFFLSFVRIGRYVRYLVNIGRNGRYSPDILAIRTVTIQIPVPQKKIVTVRAGTGTYRPKS